MRNILQSIAVWVLVAITACVVYFYSTSFPESIEPPGYQETIRRHATGDHAEDLIRFLDHRPLEETIE